MASLTNDEIVEAIGNKTVLELSELIKAVEEKFDVKAVAPIAAGVPGTLPAGEGGDSDAEEKTEFDVVLTGIGEKKIQVIKVVRAITDLGLREAKAVVDGAPKTVKEGVSKEEAENFKKQLEEVGAEIEIK